MDIKISTTIDEAIKAYKQILTDKEISVGVSRALNRTNAGVKTDSVKEIRKIYKIKAKDVRQAFSQNRATTDNLTATTTAKDKRLQAYYFNAKQNKKGVSIAVKDGRKTMSHAFIATMKNGVTLVFERFGNERKATSGRYANTDIKRQAVRSVRSVSIPYTLTNDVVDSGLTKSITTRLPTELKRQLDYILTKKTST